MVVWYLMCLILVSWFNEVTSGNCPALYQRYTNKHTFCLPRNVSCNLIKNENKVSKADIAVILKEHNSYRSRVATGEETTYHLPKASDMLQMDWGTDLAAVAQAHSDQCVFEHDCKECRVVKHFPSVGQNIFTSSTSSNSIQKPDWAAAVKAWYDEVKDFDKNQLDYFQDGKGPPPTGHFTQMIWANTWRVGCGYTLYKEGEKYKQLLTCNYGPGGNTKKHPLYQRGEPCSKCPANSCCGTACKNQNIVDYFPGLCKVIDDKGPQYAPPTGLIFYCSFNGEPDCARVTTSGKNAWEVTHTASGSYLGIVLNGGESSILSFTKPLTGDTHRCLTINYRKGPNVEGQDGTNKATEIFSIEGTSDIKADLKENTMQFKKHGMGMQWDMDTQFAIEFSVPKGKPAQFLEIKDISAARGKC